MMAWNAQIKLRQKGSTLQMLRMHHAVSTESVQPQLDTDEQQGEQGKHKAGIAACCHCMDKVSKELWAAPLSVHAEAKAEAMASAAEGAMAVAEPLAEP